LGKRNEKKCTKKETKTKKKNTWGKLQCFKEKDKKKLNFNQLNGKKIKSTKIIQKNKTKKRKYVKIILEKRKIKIKKNIWGKLKLDYQPAQY